MLNFLKQVWVSVLLWLFLCTLGDFKPVEAQSDTVLNGPGRTIEFRVAVREFTLSDGKTRCAALIGYQNSTMSCDWKN